MKHHCKTCGYKGSKKHKHIYDCCDYLNPNWMKEWMIRTKEKKHYESNFVKWSKKWD